MPPMKFLKIQLSQTCFPWFWEVKSTKSWYEINMYLNIRYIFYHARIGLFLMQEFILYILPCRNIFFIIRLLNDDYIFYVWRLTIKQLLTIDDKKYSLLTVDDKNIARLTVDNTPHANPLTAISFKHFVQFFQLCYMRKKKKQEWMSISHKNKPRSKHNWIHPRW